MFVRSLVACLLLAVAPAHALAGLAGPKPMGDYFPEDAKFQIVWRDSFDQTLKASMEQWKAALAGEKDPSNSALRTYYRQCRLCLAWLDRYPNDPAARLPALRLLALNYSQMMLTGQGNYWRKQIIDENPGRLSLAVEQLNGIFMSLEAYYVEERADWAEYACERVMALRRAGELGEEHPILTLALKAGSSAVRARFRLAESERLLRQYQDRAGQDNWSDSNEAYLYLEAGRMQAGLAILDRLAARKAIGNESYIHAALQGQSRQPPSFPRPLAMEMRWEGLQNHEVGNQAEAWLALQKESAENVGLMRLAGDAHASVWAAADAHLRSQPAEQLADIRKAACKAAGDLAGLDSGDSLTVLKAFRRCPWAPAAQQAMLRTAADDLHAGRAGWAVAACHDVLDHADDQPIIKTAQSLQTLALAQDTADEPSPGGARLAGMTSKMLTLPAGAWPTATLDRLLQEDYADFSPMMGQVQPAAGGFVVSGPRLLARYDDQGKLRWSQVFQYSLGPLSDVLRTCPVPGDFLPCVAEGKVFSRWGLDDVRQIPIAVAAFDLAQGKMLWSTSGQAAWKNLVPIGDPTYSEGRVYVPAVQQGQLAQAAVYCLDAATGATIWKVPLATQYLPVLGVYRLEAAGSVDVTHYGNRLTVHQGRVYCSNNLGYVACLDARDGLPLWARVYERSLPSVTAYPLYHRLGSPPLIAGEAVLVMPRDGAGVMALSTRTGELLWDSPLMGCDEPLGLLDGLLLVKDDHDVSCLDTQTGRVVWSRRFEQLACRPKLAGAELVIATATQLLKLDARTGQLLESSAAPAGGRIQEFALSGKTMAYIAPQSAGQAPAGSPTVAGSTGSTGLKPVPMGNSASSPLTEKWRLERGDCRVFFPPSGNAEPAVMLYSDGILERVDVPAGDVRWRRLAAPGFRRCEWTKDLLILLYRDQALALDLASGDEKWRASLPVVAWRSWVFDNYLVIGNFYNNERAVAVLDAKSGRVLWNHYFTNEPHWGMGLPSFADVGYDGKNLHLYTCGNKSGTPVAEVVMSPADGKLLSGRRLDQQGAQLLAWSSAGAAFFGDDSKVHLVRPDGAKTDLQTAMKFSGKPANRMFVAGKWVVVQHADVRYSVYDTWVWNLDDPAYSFNVKQDVQIHGDRAIGFAPDGRLMLIDLPSKTRKDLPWPIDAGKAGWLPAGYAVDGNRLWGFVARPGGQIVAALYDMADGKMLSSQPLPGVSLQGVYPVRTLPPDVLSSFRVVGQSLLAGDSYGLHCLEQGKPVAPAVNVAYRPAGQVNLDGKLDDWDASTAIALSGPDGAAGKLMLASDEKNLYLAIVYPAAGLKPMIGTDESGGGDRLEVGIGKNTRFVAGVDGKGQMVFHSFADGVSLAGARGAASFDWQTGQAVYELALPFAAGASENRLPMSLTVWTDGGSGSRRLFVWGEALAGQDGDESRHQIVRLYNVTRQADLAMRQLCDKLPDLPFAFDDLLRSMRVHAAGGDEFVEQADVFLKNHPRSANAAAMLWAADQALRTPQDDPSAALVKLARQAGVPEEAIGAYQKAAAVKPPAAPTPVGGAAIDPAAAEAAIKEVVPRLGNSPLAYSALQELVKIKGETSKEQLYQWFVQTCPNHPAMEAVLNDMLANTKGLMPALKKVDEFVQQSAVSEELKFLVRRASVAKSPITTWQITPGLPQGGKAYPDAAGVDLAARFKGFDGPAGWKVFATPGTGVVHVPDQRPKGEHATAYAVCWVNLPKAQTVIVETGVHCQSQLLLNGHLVREYSSSHVNENPNRDGITRVSMPAGWSQLLLRMDSAAPGTTIFRVELVDPSGSGPPEGVKTSALPPTTTSSQ